MKKKFIIIMLLLIGSTVALDATQCGGTYYYFSQSTEHPVGTTHNDPVGAVIDAFMNCCSGSSITIYDVDTGTSETLSITEDGANATCTPY